MRPFDAFMLASLAIVSIVQVALVFLARRRIRRQPHSVALGRSTPPLASAFLPLLVVQLTGMPLRAVPQAGVAFVAIWWALVLAGPLAAWLHGTWIHDEGLELRGRHFSWSRAARARLLQDDSRPGGFLLEVDPGTPDARSLTVPVARSRVEAAQSLLNRLNTWTDDPPRLGRRAASS